MLLSRSITYTFFLLCSLWVISCQVISKPFQSSRIKELATYCDTIIDTFTVYKGIKSIIEGMPCRPFTTTISTLCYTPCQQQLSSTNLELSDSVQLCNEELYIQIAPINQYYDKHTVYSNTSKKKLRKQLTDPKKYSDFVLVKQGDLFWSNGCQWRVDSIYIDTPRDCELCVNIDETYVRFVLVDCLQEFKERGRCKCATRYIVGTLF